MNTDIVENTGYITTANSVVLKTAKVAGIAAILSLLATVAGIITFISNPGVYKDAGLEGFGADSKDTIVTAIFSFFSIFISLVINVVLFYFLFNFYYQTTKAYKDKSNPRLLNGLHHLGLYFRVCAIILVCTVVLMALSFLGQIFSAVL